MKKNLPAATRLAHRVHGRKGIAGSVSFLLGKRAELKPFSEAADLALAADEHKSLRGHVHHLVRARAAILTELWPRGLFVGVQVVDDLLLRALQDPGILDPVKHVFEVIRDHGVHRPGLLIFPVHSLGVLGAGLFSFVTGAQTSLVVKDYGLAVTPQTNDFGATLRFLNDARAQFGVTQQLPLDLLEHWRRSRSLSWLSSNPLVVVRTQSYPGSYYENQSLLISKLQFATSFLFLMAAFQAKGIDRHAHLSSSALVNNFSTLDLRHYIVLFRGLRAKELNGDCVPMMNLSRPALVELTDVAVEVDPAHWGREPVLGARLTNALRRVEEGFFSARFGDQVNAVRSRVNRKMFNALSYFRRSFRKVGRADEPLVHLGTAFEVLLTDHYSRGVGARILRRLRLALAGEPDATELFGSVENLYGARSKALHDGEALADIDLRLAQRAFATTFLLLAERLPRLRTNAKQPIGSMLGDAPEKSVKECDCECHK